MPKSLLPGKGQRTERAAKGSGVVHTAAGGTAVVLSTTDRRVVHALPKGTVREITNLHRLNDIRRLNQFLSAVNRKLPVGGCFIGRVETSEQIKRRLFSRYPYWVVWPYYVLFFLFRRVLPKLKWTRKPYYVLTDGHDQVLSRAEVLGRLACCGFEILEYNERDGMLHFVARKKQPLTRPADSPCGLFFVTRRIGEGGRTIYFYKLRTMHPYAEHLQAYVYAENNLQPNGKFKDDFRITTWGRFMRKTWIDELPMLVNWLKGDLKLVGVRPLSEHYLSLYPPALVERRLRHKPGLLPPFYADLPEGFDEILASEERYLEACEEHPLAADVQYFLRAAYNIAIKRARSQ